MYEIYTLIKDKEIEKKVMKIEQADPSMQYMEIWNLINEITGRKSTQSSQLNELYEDRILLWYEHFRNLLGITPKITDENEKIPRVFENLNINDDKFTSEGYERSFARSKDQ